jgi:hypothetical protein
MRVVTGFDKRFGDMYANKKSDVTVLFETNHFLLQSVSESRAEKSAIVETFGETYIYLFGSRPKIYNYTGILIDTRGLNWLNQWRQAYDSFFRGSKLAQERARVFLLHEDVIREGIVLQDSINYSADNLGFATVSFSLYVTNEAFLEGLPYSGVVKPSVTSTNDTKQKIKLQIKDITNTPSGSATDPVVLAAHVTSDVFKRFVAVATIEEKITAGALSADQTEVKGFSGTFDHAVRDEEAIAVIESVTSQGRVWSPTGTAQPQVLAPVAPLAPKAPPPKVAAPSLPVDLTPATAYATGRKPLMPARARITRGGLGF